MSPVGGPLNRITPDVGAPAQGHGHWGNMPSGPFVLSVPKKPRGSNLAQNNPTNVGMAKGEPKLPSWMPSAGAVDYAHKFTSTSLILAGLVGLLLFGSRKPKTLLRALAGKHVAAVR